MTEASAPGTGSAAWESHYRSRLVDASEAVACLEPGDHIWVAVGQQVGLLIAAVLGRLPEAAPVTMTWLPFEDLSWYDEEMSKQFKMNVVFSSPFSREPVNDFRADFVPWMVLNGQKAQENNRPGHQPVDVSFISVSPPNANGYVCFGSTLWDAKRTALMARKVIAIVNENTVHTFGDTWLHVSDIDWFVDYTTPPPELRWAYPPIGPEEMTIAHLVADLINDGDTLQLGTGGTTGAIPRSGALDGKHDLGYFAELTVPGTVELVRKGVITGKKMNTHPGKFVTTTAGNSPEDMAFIHENPTFEFYSTDYMHDPGAIARNERMVAVNNAISIDLTGQIAAGQIGTQVWSGTGGQLAYAMGSFMSRKGASITVLPSTARGGTVSRITAGFVPGQVVTVPRDIADIVVTEFGVAHLLNKNQRQRAEELISVAHPDFRAELRKEAARLVGL